VSSERLVLELRERRAAPECERLTQQLTGLRCLARGELLATSLEQGLEPFQIECTGRDSDPISGVGRLDHALAERPAQAARREPARP
jgi:hypothetical protein